LPGGDGDARICGGAERETRTLRTALGKRALNLAGFAEFHLGADLLLIYRVRGKVPP
jgi:hypothetical protein